MDSSDTIVLLMIEKITLLWNQKNYNLVFLDLNVGDYKKWISFSSSYLIKFLYVHLIKKRIWLSHVNISLNPSPTKNIQFDVKKIGDVWNEKIHNTILKRIILSNLSAFVFVLLIKFLIILSFRWFIATFFV